jgi:hypothetical protein
VEGAADRKANAAQAALAADLLGAGKRGERPGEHHLIR